MTLTITNLRKRFGEFAIAITLNSRMMHEHVRAVFALNKAKPFLGIKPLDGATDTFSHFEEIPSLLVKPVDVVEVGVA